MYRKINKNIQIVNDKKKTQGVRGKQNIQRDENKKNKAKTQINTMKNEIQNSINNIKNYQDDFLKYLDFATKNGCHGPIETANAGSTPIKTVNGSGTIPTKEPYIRGLGDFADMNFYHDEKIKDYLNTDKFSIALNFNDENTGFHSIADNFTYTNKLDFLNNKYIVWTHGHFLAVFKEGNEVFVISSLGKYDIDSMIPDKTLKIHYISGPQQQYNQCAIHAVVNLKHAEEIVKIYKKTNLYNRNNKAQKPKNKQMFIKQENSKKITGTQQILPVKKLEQPQPITLNPTDGKITQKNNLIEQKHTLNESVFQNRNDITNSSFNEERKYLEVITQKPQSVFIESLKQSLIYNTELNQEAISSVFANNKELQATLEVIKGIIGDDNTECYNDILLNVEMSKTLNTSNEEIIKNLKEMFVLLDITENNIVVELDKKKIDNQNKQVSNNNQSTNNNHLQSKETIINQPIRFTLGNDNITISRYPNNFNIEALKKLYNNKNIIYLDNLTEEESISRYKLIDDKYICGICMGEISIYSIDEIFKNQNKVAENAHDYIQILFPTNEKSFHGNYNLKVSNFKKLEENLNLISSGKMSERVIFFQQFLSEKSNEFWTNSNHNFLRISRVFDSVTCLLEQNKDKKSTLNYRELLQNIMKFKDFIKEKCNANQNNKKLQESRVFYNNFFNKLENLENNNKTQTSGFSRT